MEFAGFVDSPILDAHDESLSWTSDVRPNCVMQHVGNLVAGRAGVLMLPESKDLPSGSC